MGKTKRIKGEKRSRRRRRAPAGPKRSPTGIHGFDQLSGGGLPTGRTTVIVGHAGAGKTLFALETLARGARDQGEPGLFIAFEESPGRITENVAGFDWATALGKTGVELVDGRLSASVLHAGSFDLYGLLAALEAKIRQTGAKRIVFDGIDVLLDLLDDPVAERREVLRLHEWLGDSGLTALLTAKSSSGTPALPDRYAFMEFMADCVVGFQHDLDARYPERRLCIRKYRGGQHSSSRVPFVITARGLEIFGQPAAEVHHPVFTDRVSTGVERLDGMLGGGYFRGSSVLVSGAPGTAKTTLAGAFAQAACRHGERALVISFDESPAQIVRNLASVRIDLEPHLRSGRLALHSFFARSRSPGELVASPNRS